MLLKISEFKRTYLQTCLENNTTPIKELLMYIRDKEDGKLILLA